MKDSIKRGQFVRVTNKPPYQHIRASRAYFATRGEVVCDGQQRTLDLLFTPNEIRRAAHRAHKNREDIPDQKRESILEFIEEWLGL